ncbi:hypothetical protein EDB85DRAFT_1892743 [Lactarius pseudohatsudake]|nr:hypothetical protein EDB85DRAFT_1892743 [Lactarius pseudohatsudake]
MCGAMLAGKAGNVKYHLGANYVRPTPSIRQEGLYYSSPTLSHLEVCDPVVLGKTHAIQFLENDELNLLERADIEMKFITIPLLVAGPGLAAANPLHAPGAPGQIFHNYFSPMCSWISGSPTTWIRQEVEPASTGHTNAFKGKPLLVGVLAGNEFLEGLGPSDNVNSADPLPLYPPPLSIVLLAGSARGQDLDDMSSDESIPNRTGTGYDSHEYRMTRIKIKLH